MPFRGKTKPIPTGPHLTCGKSIFNIFHIGIVLANKAETVWRNQKNKLKKSVSIWPGAMKKKCFAAVATIEVEIIR